MPRIINSTYVTLIPKIPKATSIKNYRPIAYCSVIYNKIISKVLTNRMQGVLDSIIRESQSVFIKGRVIFDNIILSHELVKIDLQRHMTLLNGLLWNILCLNWVFLISLWSGWWHVLPPHLILSMSMVICLVLFKLRKDLDKVIQSLPTSLWSVWSIWIGVWCSLRKTPSLDTVIPQILTS